MLPLLSTYFNAVIKGEIQGALSGAFTSTSTVCTLMQAMTQTEVQKHRNRLRSGSGHFIFIIIITVIISIFQMSLCLLDLRYFTRCLGFQVFGYD